MTTEIKSMEIKTRILNDTKIQNISSPERLWATQHIFFRYRATSGVEETGTRAEPDLETFLKQNKKTCQL